MTNKKPITIIITDGGDEVEPITQIIGDEE